MIDDRFTMVGFLCKIILRKVMVHKNTDREITLNVCAAMNLSDAPILSFAKGGWGGWCILLSLHFYWYSGKYKRCNLNKSEGCPTLGGQCLVSVSVRLETLGKTWRDSWSYLSLLFIVPVTPPTVPTEVQTFCPPLWSFAQRFAQCTAHCSGSLVLNS